MLSRGLLKIFTKLVHCSILSNFLQYLDRVPAVTLKAEATGPGTISATWDLKTTPATDPYMYGLNYQVTKKNMHDPIQQGSLPLTATSLTASGLEPSTEYTVSITTVGLYSRNTATYTTTTVKGGKKKVWFLFFKSLL